MNVYSLEFCWMWMAKRTMSKPVNTNSEISVWIGLTTTTTTTTTLSIKYYRTSNIWANVIKFYINDFLSQMHSMSMHNISRWKVSSTEIGTEIERELIRVLVRYAIWALYFHRSYCKHFDWINFWCNFLKWPRFEVLHPLSPGEVQEIREGLAKIMSGNVVV